MPSRRTLPSLVFSAALALIPTAAQAAVPETGATAADVMTATEHRAAAEHKNILLTFGASWCGNCRLFDKFLADPTIRPIIDKAFVLADLDTGEHASDTRHANIPGGEKIQNALGGKDAGYPYIVMLDPTGKLLAGSNRPANLAHPGNIGYPVAPWEIDWFLDMLKKSAPTLTPQDTATIRTWLTTHGPGH
jgi:thioredoxin-related protein